MTIAITWIRIALDRRGAGHWHRPRVAFGTVGRECYVDRGLRSAHDRVGNPNIRTLILSRSKIGVHPDGRADETDDAIRVRIHGRAGNILVPEVVAAKGTEPVKAGALSGAHCTTSALAAPARAAAA